jgi:hypothetical protein
MWIAPGYRSIYLARGRHIDKVNSELRLMIPNNLEKRTSPTLIEGWNIKRGRGPFLATLLKAG